MTSRTLTPAGRLDWLRLARTESVGPVTFSQLIRRYGDASAALAALPELSRRGGRTAPLKVCTPAEAEGEIAAGEHLGARKDHRLAVAHVAFHADKFVLGVA